MRHTGDAEHIPVLPVNGCLVAHHQGCQHACQAGGICLVWQCVGMGVFATACHRCIDPGPHDLAHGVQAPRCFSQTKRRRVFAPHAHITGGCHALAPQPQLAVKPVRVGQTVRLAQAHRQLPALATARRGTPRLVDPTQQHPGWVGHHLPVGLVAVCPQLGVVGLEHQPPAQWHGAGQISHPAGQQQRLPFQFRRKHPICPTDRPPAGAAPAQRCKACHGTDPHHPGTPLTRPAQPATADEKRSTQAHQHNRHGAHRCINMDR